VPAFLIDTDWVIDHFNGILKATGRLRELQPRGLAVSIISVAELWEGVHFSRDPAQSQAQLQRFLEGLIVLGFDEATCKRFGQLRGELRIPGQTVGDFDLLIAATALVHDLTLLTNNRRHFERIRDLRVESAAP
jgi:tRNA(fMet)-specific endonuclease VapC